MPGDLILAFKTFCDMLPAEDADKCMFLMHTQPVDQNGTDLPAVVKAICPEYKVIFSDKKIPPQHLNYLYNLSDITVNIASNEGWGLGTTESLMTGTPIIVLAVSGTLAIPAPSCIGKGEPIVVLNKSCGAAT